MLLTEREAKQKQCCGPSDCGYRHPDNNIRWCIASQCMAWRWDGPSSVHCANTADEFKPPSGSGPPTLTPHPPDEDYNWRAVWPKDQHQWFGWTNWEKEYYSKNSLGCCGYAPDERFSRIHNMLRRLQNESRKNNKGD